MPQSFHKLYTHLIFSTKDRQPHLTPEIREKIHRYIAGIVRNLDSPFACVGGTSDHVHIHFDISKHHRPMEVVRIIKSESSKFTKTLGPTYSRFSWQRGYGMFSVSPPNRPKIEAYIRNQEEHHRLKTFQEEYRHFLELYEIEYDERYLWD